MLRIEIETDNEAFQDDNAGPECARILRNLADRVESRGLPVDAVSIRDINGNRVGEMTVG